MSWFKQDMSVAFLFDLFSIISSPFSLEFKGNSDIFMKLDDDHHEFKWCKTANLGKNCNFLIIKCSNSTYIS